ncbi:MAG: sigma-70 family RNA polymerase sigma factor [Bacteroidota bacterium]
MYTNLQISRTLVKNNQARMDSSRKTVSKEAMQEEWLVIQAAKKNPAQFRPLYNRYYENIFSFIFRRTANETLTAELVSNVFLKALQRLSSYEFKGVPFSAWLFRIASNEVAQYFRNSQKHRIVSVDESHFADMIEEMEERDHPNYRQAMIHALDELKEEEIQLIEMRFFEIRPFKEIAGILEITESNAKIKTYRLLDKLRKIILKNSEQGQARP